MEERVLFITWIAHNSLIANNKQDSQISHSIPSTLPTIAKIIERQHENNLVNNVQRPDQTTTSSSDNNTQNSYPVLV